MPKKIIFIKKGNSTFINKDETYLRDNYNTTTIQIQQFHGFRLLLEQLGIFFRLLIQMRNYDAVFIWFADFHGFFPVVVSRLYKKKSLVVLGGYDVYCLPEYDYGICTHPIRNFCAQYIYRNASHVLTLGKQMQKDVMRLAGKGKHFSRILNLPTGFDPDLWHCDTIKEQSVIMVAIADSQRRIKIKGIDRFIEVAAEMPQFNFYLIGLKNIEDFYPTLPGNVHSYGYVESLRKLYSVSTVYLQLSLTEGFPSVVCEAMLCECIPIATDVGGTREIVGDTGYVIEKYSKEHTRTLIQKAMESYDKLKGETARKRITEKFSFNRRKENIDAILREASTQ